MDSESLVWAFGIEQTTYLTRGVCAPTLASDVLKNEALYDTGYRDGVVSSALEAWVESLPSKGDTCVSFPIRFDARDVALLDNPITNPIRETQEGCRLLHDKVQFKTRGSFKSVDACVQDFLARKTQWLASVQELGVGFPEHGGTFDITTLDQLVPHEGQATVFHLTLPTEVDERQMIQRYRVVARLFQWLTPFLLVRFGIGDPFSSVSVPGRHFANGSRRLATCLSVGPGIYDTDRMPRGAPGTVPYERTEGRWYEMLHDHPETPYKSSGVLGLDLQFCEGMEFRIFDDVRDDELAEVLGLLVWCGGESLVRETVPNPRQDPLWNQVMVRCLLEGGEAVLLPVEASRFRDVLGCSESLPLPVLSAYDAIRTGASSDWGTVIRSALEPQLSSSALLETMGTTSSKPTAAAPVPKPVADLSGAVVAPVSDLSGAVAPVADISGAVIAPVAEPVSDLSGAVAPVADISGAVADLSGAVVDLSGAVADLSGAVADLSGAVADLSGATPVAPLAIETAPVVGGKKICCCC